jgi:hypothetical protein
MFMNDTVNATPTKRLFIKMLTRDLSLEDVILDLVDNAIDSACRKQKVDLTAAALLRAKSHKTFPKPKANIEITFDQESFVIEDTCGGISVLDAKNTVFRFGKTNEDDRGALSVYGIGLKRAVFKLGQRIEIDSRTDKEGFRVTIDTEKWMADDETESPDWSLPLEPAQGASSRHPAGTTIRVKKLNSEVRGRFKDDTFDSRLRRIVSNTYALFLERFVTLKINGLVVKPSELPLASSKEINTGIDRFSRHDVDVDLLAGITTRPYRTEQAGWYVFCNGRVVVNADKTELTGWGGTFPQFHSKYAGFVGYAFFHSEKPDLLPWTTTKRGLNWESDVYMVAMQRIKTMARPVLDFLNLMYDTPVIESPAARELAEKVQPAKLDKLVKSKTIAFAYSNRVHNSANDVTTQYKAKNKKLSKQEKHSDHRR